MRSPAYVVAERHFRFLVGIPSCAVCAGRCAGVDVVTFSCGCQVIECARCAEWLHVASCDD